MPTVEIMLASGDIYHHKYDIPAEPPPEEDIDGTALYYKALHVIEFNTQQNVLRNKAKRDFLLSTCVHIINGPERYEDDDWVSELEAFAPGKYVVPTHPGARRLLFIKMRVLIYSDELERVMAIATYQEVSESGIGHALSSFRDQMAGQPTQHVPEPEG